MPAAVKAHGSNAQLGVPFLFQRIFGRDETRPEHFVADPETPPASEAVEVTAGATERAPAESG